MKDKDVLRKGEALYRSYKEKDRRAILNEFPYGWNQKFELECCMDNNIDIKPIANINIKSYHYKKQQSHFCYESYRCEKN